jgi:hypothetical protein
MYIFPLELLSIIKDYLFDYRKTFTKNVLPFIKQNYPIKLYSIGPITSALEVMNSRKCLYKMYYVTPKQIKFSNFYVMEDMEKRYTYNLNNTPNFLNNIEGFECYNTRKKF